MVIISKQRNNDKELSSDKKVLYRYWRLLEPDIYAKKMVAISKRLQRFAAMAQDVVFRGQIMQTSDGMVFVNVPNAIFDGFLPMLPDAEKPPENEKHYDDIGAHITVILNDEIQDNNIKFKDVGKTVSYKMKGLQEVVPDNWEEMEKVWFISVESPDLETLRKSYDLSPKILNHEFHITLAIKRKPITIEY